MNEIPNQKIIIRIEADMRELVPGYLEHRRQDVDKIKEALSRGDMDEIRMIGHKMKGSGGGYGFSLLTQIGTGIEEAAKASDMAAVPKYLDQLLNFFEHLEIIYE